jgi:hypothetical protein
MAQGYLAVYTALSDARGTLPDSKTAAELPS